MILCLGTTPALQRSMIFDHLKIDAVNRAAEVTEYASGKAINAARVLHTLGKPVIATGFLGDKTGRLVREDLDRAGIRHEFHEVAARTRMCITLIDRATSQATELVEESQAVNGKDCSTLILNLIELLNGSSLLMLLGSLPPEAPSDFYAACVKVANRAGVRTVLDAKGAPMNLALAERPFIVKPNRNELEETIGSSIDTDGKLRDGIRGLIDRGPTWAAVTNGAGPITISDGKSFWQIMPPIVETVSPIGSGDSFAAGLAAAIADGANVPEACVLGTACAVANALTPLAGHVDQDEVERLRAKVRLREWN